MSSSKGNRRVAEQGGPCGRTEGEEGHVQTAVQCWEQAGLAAVLKPKARGRVHVWGTGPSQGP